MSKWHLSFNSLTITETFWWNDVNCLYRVSPHPSVGSLQETGWRTWVWRLPTPHKTRRSPASVPSHIDCLASPLRNLWRVNELVTWLFTNSLLWHCNDTKLIILMFQVNHVTECWMNCTQSIGKEDWFWRHWSALSYYINTAVVFLKFTYHGLYCIYFSTTNFWPMADNNLHKTGWMIGNITPMKKKFTERAVRRFWDRFVSGTN